MLLSEVGAESFMDQKSKEKDDERNEGPVGNA
jgi:hypothetical protein